MSKVKIRSFCSPTLVLLAFDWAEGKERSDFLGFAIERSPGFRGATKSWLPNRIDFDGPDPNQADKPSREAPIQKFQWWDSRIDTKDRGSKFKYRIIPIVGSPTHLEEVSSAIGQITVAVPELQENGVGTYFNRAVVSSQAFARRFSSLEKMADVVAAREWLANGMETAVPTFLSQAGGKHITGAIYHLSDDLWLIPALKDVPSGRLSLVYNKTSQDDESDDAIRALIAAGHKKSMFKVRSKANIMHNKFLIRTSAKRKAEALLTGSANFTSSGLCQQANVLHTFESPALADLYLNRKKLLETNPTLGATAEDTGWSDSVEVAGGEARVFFSPEKKPDRVSLERIISSLRSAESSVVFCCFIPTDLRIINACLEAGDDNRMMFGLINSANEPSESDTSYESKIILYHRSRDQRDVMGRSAFAGDATPFGFLPERRYLPHEDPRRAVRIHHKFVLIDAETDRPILYTGSANLSNNSLYNNDENLLEIIGSRQLADAYLAEFLRLYEHYRARLSFERYRSGQTATFKLTPNADWARKHYRPGSPESRARQAMVAEGA